MSERKVVVPHGMFCAAHQAQEGHNGGIDGGLTGAIVEAALRWLGENPMVPTYDQAGELQSKISGGTLKDFIRHGAVEWQRRCFLVPSEHEYREIHLTKGQVALVDPDDFDRLNAVEWYARQSGTTFYAERHVQLENGLRGVSSMHREAIGAEPGEFVDHVDRNGLHNYKTNLRRCNEDQNKQNVGPHADKQTSKYKGVCRNESKGKYMARIGYGGSMHHIGYFDLEEDAARAYDREARIHHGEFAYLNFPDDPRMFLAPEPEVEPLTMYIMRHFDDVELDKQTLRNRAEAAVSDFREYENRNVPEPEVPEEIKDLLDKYERDGYVNDNDLLEAYRRGLAKR